MLGFKKQNKDAGFSLIEAALALAIMGIVAGLAIPALLNMLQIGKIKTTHAHQEAVMTALATYALRKGYLPYPADPTNPGVECEGLVQSKGAIGGIPYITLGIPEKYAKDGFNHPMIYAVPKYYRESEFDHIKKYIQDVLASNARDIDTSDIKNFSKDILVCFQGRNDSYIDVINMANQNLFLSSDLLSSTDKIEDHSSSGEGAGEIINHNNNLEFMDRPYSTQPKDKHRHILKWVSRDFLMAHYGHISCPAIRAQVIRESSKGSTDSVSSP
jgi:prepilin-type N-terminal cleavage/methylation domain-containing protein